MSSPSLRLGRIWRPVSKVTKLHIFQVLSFVHSTKRFVKTSKQKVVFGKLPAMIQKYDVWKADGGGGFHILPLDNLEIIDLVGITVFRRLRSNLSTYEVRA